MKYYCLLLVLLFAFSCNKEGEIQDDVAGDGIAGDVTDTPYKFPVIVMKAIRGDLSSYISLNGDVDTKVKLAVFPDVAGKIISLDIKLGTYVNKGQIIATLDPSKPGFLYLKSAVRAPISGYVLSVNCKIGETITPQTSVALIGKMDFLQIKTYVPEKYFLDIKIGNNAIIELESYPGEKFKAKVSEMSPIVDFKSRAAEVYLDPIENIINKMVVGMFVKIKLVTKHAKNVIKIPKRALIEQEGRLCLFRVNVDTETVERVFPLVEFEVDNVVSIKDSIAENDLIVTEGVSLLSDGAFVDVVDIHDGLGVEDNI
ncbi:efflux RND transporter periplasmic adaptor subunit [Borrelia persica]|uniref:efflux RND transporter periplasmic adaptor subunit n=1 Tax=Borrelia persica TaxID=44448 RepID=UPI0004AED59D|nr:efflux RND transporter periplasmic adaptor subunit [Borrelia persica]